MSEFNCTCEAGFHSTSELKGGICPNGGRIWGMDGKTTGQLEWEARHENGLCGDDSCRCVDEYD